MIHYNMKRANEDIKNCDRALYHTIEQLHNAFNHLGRMLYMRFQSLQHIVENRLVVSPKYHTIHEL